MNKSQKYLLKTQFLTNMYMYVNSAHNFQVLHNLNIWPKLWIRSTWNIYIPVVSMTQHIFDLPVYICMNSILIFPFSKSFQSKWSFFLRKKCTSSAKGVAEPRKPAIFYIVWSLPQSAVHWGWWRCGCSMDMS